LSDSLVTRVVTSFIWKVLEDLR